MGNFLKFVFFILILPVVYATASAFYQEIDGLPTAMRKPFVTGSIAYIISFFFVYDFRSLYDFGKKVLNDVFRFFGTFGQMIATAIPFYALLVVILYFFIVLLLRNDLYEGAYFTLITFFLTMHIAMTARELYEGDNELFKPNYFFAMGLVFICTMVLGALGLDLIIARFSFADFCSEALEITNEIYQSVFRKLL